MTNARRRLRLGLLLATLAGLLLAGWTIGRAGLGDTLQAMTSIGWAGMAVFILWSGVVLLLLGAAWWAVAPGQPAARIGLFAWARTTREGATDVLPFAQFGGLVVGARTLTAQGVPDALVYASMIADLTTEMAAQLLFTLGGVAVLLLVLADLPVRDGLLPLVLGGAGGMAAIMLLFLFAQRPMLRLAAALGARLLPAAVTTIEAIRGRLDAIYAEPARPITAFALNMAAWAASAFGAWIALAFMGAAPPVWAVVTLEALIFTVRSVAFLIPGALGVQEASYAVLGPLLGVPPETALALSLLKRARDLAIGAPALLIWQAGEVRALTRPAGVSEQS